MALAANCRIRFPPKAPEAPDEPQLAGPTEQNHLVRRPEQLRRSSVNGRSQDQARTRTNEARQIVNQRLSLHLPPSPSPSLRRASHHLPPSLSTSPTLSTLLSPSWTAPFSLTRPPLRPPPGRPYELPGRASHGRGRVPVWSDVGVGQSDGRHASFSS
ncbi:hypothetical protein BGZ61DRAFT_453684 [Ilyonectria robusta]|uniref:uncharacterized protein n=1 Tax=Ilyonectria robusta TaxID=1079257 RepID=UPI001E8D4000|nr:uncharacterized protein BGZ61DRAFT_453684 [Ilyonectria robusta]KAH8686807.1 hypothetical protein BGZ61DRAFT_453684 [Ilyonectria robusta]